MRFALPFESWQLVNRHDASQLMSQRPRHSADGNERSHLA
jgi:hypothetical protein